MTDMKIKYYGFTLENKPRLVDYITDIEELGINFIQIFTSQATGYKQNKYSKTDYNIFREYLEYNKCKVVIHGSLILNFCNNKYIQEKCLIDDLNTSVLIGAIGVIIHMGKNVIKDIKKANDNYVNSIKRILSKSHSDSIIILETGASVGSEINSKTMELYRLYNRFNDKEKKRIKICIDTCHIYSSNEYISDPKYVDIYYMMIKLLFGFDKIACIHLNNSKYCCGAKKDRHADIISGEISKCGIKRFVEKFGGENIPIVYETPCDIQTKSEQIAILKNWLIINN